MLPARAELRRLYVQLPKVDAISEEGRVELPGPYVPNMSYQ